MPNEASTALSELYQADSLRLLNEVVFPAVERYGSWSGELEMRTASGSVPVLSVVLAHRSRGQSLVTLPW